MKMVDVAGLEPVTPCLQSGAVKTLTALSGVAYTEQRVAAAKSAGEKRVAVIEFLEWIEGDRLRHSKFVGLRDDKDPRSVVKEHSDES
jgi:ATP-dependent DNA ligase